jgi:hypothetical protein
MSKSKKQQIQDWEEYRDNIFKSTPIDLKETPIQKEKRIKKLEENDEEWFKYYFPNYYSSEPADFHKRSTKRVMSNMEWMESRVWARELAKSARTMMEYLKLAMTGKKKCIIMASITEESAINLLKPFKINLESNNRLKNDYGVQQRVGSWESHLFITKKGVAFVGLGVGGNPRGFRNEELRPDAIIIDDIDTDEDCRNPKTVKKKFDWVDGALLGTRSISKDLLVVINGNLIAKYSVVALLKALADHAEIVNIRDKNGKSTWPQKNTEARIDRVLSKKSYAAAQKEYFNNPIVEGTTFKEVYYDSVPPINKCSSVVVYADPATSNKSQGGGSYKAVVIVGYKFPKFYVYWIRLDLVKQSDFVDWMFEAYKYLVISGVDNKKMWLENNSLQNPHYEQVLKPLIDDKARLVGYHIPLSLDTESKADKYSRIEATLEPLNRNGNLIFDKKLIGDPNMKTMEDQMLSVAPETKIMDGPDAVEGAVSKIQKGIIYNETSYHVVPRTSFKH